MTEPLESRPEATTDSPPPAVSSSPARPRGVSSSRVAMIVVPLFLLAALIGFGWALGWHEPIVAALFQPKLVEAGGRVTFNGEPLEYGTVMTLPASSLSEPAIGVLGEGGTFTLRTNGVPGAAVGQHRVAVMAMTSGFPPKPLVPPEYVDAATSPLVIDVASDPAQNSFELNLTGTLPGTSSDEGAADTAAESDSNSEDRSDAVDQPSEAAATEAAATEDAPEEFM